MSARDLPAEALAVPGTVVVCHNPFQPWRDRTVRPLPRKRVRVCTLAPRTRQPVVCLLNGQPLPPHAWRRRVARNDHVAFVVLPHGGKSNPLQLIAAIAIAWAAPYANIALAEAFGYAVNTTFGAVMQGVIGAGLSLVSSALLGGASSLRTRDTPAPSPTYNLQAQGNQARVGQPIPVIYGRHVVYPDFAAQPYIEYSGGEQYLYQLFVIGQGYYDIEQVRIADTPVSSFAEIETEVVAPGGTLTLFPGEVVTADEVSGQEATTGVALGPFVANAAGSQANYIGVDLIMPRGLYFANADGELETMTIVWRVEAQKIDDLGAPVGGWIDLSGSVSYAAATTTPVRVSYKYAVSAGRYQVRVTRLNAKITDVRTGHELAWGGLRAYLRSVRSYGGVTLLAVKARASNNLSGSSARRINAIVQRRLPVWDGSAWSAPVATRSIAWALADIARAQYGARLADSRIDLAGLRALDAVWSARGDTCDIVLDQSQTVWDALATVARCGRAMPFVQGGVLRVVRDQLQTLPTAMFTMRNIVRGSLSLEYAMATEETADAVDVSYFDASTWTERTVRCALPDSAQTTVRTMQLPGVTNRAQAWREGMFMAACNRYRRRTVSFQTEMEGLVLSLGDLIAVQHDMPQWGAYSEVTAWDGAGLAATLAHDMDWSGGPHYIALRARDGSVMGPYAVTRGGADNVAVLDEAPTEAPYTGTQAERTHVAFGQGEALYVRAIVLSVRPQSNTRAEVLAIVESDFVHTAETGAVPGTDAWQLPITPTRPRVAGLIARSDALDVGNALLSWAPAPGADRYLIEVSADGESWTRAGETSATTYTCRALYGAATRFRVAALGAALGPWAEVLYGSSAAYMWDADPATLMWSVDDTLPMWRY